MSEDTGNTVSSLTIAEQRPQRPGGCVGIFFQLFDWNRRLAKKKLFSKKLLPPVRVKRISKKFGSDEKLPVAKLHLMADENRGGFPNKKPESDSTSSSQFVKPASLMRSPGLVARLMGLESMPVVHCDKPKKGLSSQFCYDQDKKSRNHDYNLNRTSEFTGYELNSGSENRSVKVDSSSQTLQKRVTFERKAVSRFGTEALQFKGALSRSKKQHPKLASPVKSPRIRSGRNAARLIEAATKILEPGLHASNRAKCALTYSASPRLPQRDERMIEGVAMLSPNHSRESTYLLSEKSLKGQSSCRSCGNLMDVDFRSNVEDQVPEVGFSASDSSNTFSEGLGKVKINLPLFHEQERDVDIGRSDILKSQVGDAPLAVQAMAHVQSRTEKVTERKIHPRKDQDQCTATQQMKDQLEVGSLVLTFNNQKQNQRLLVKDKIPPKPKLCTRQMRRDSSVDSVSGTKDYISLNRNLNNQTRTRMYTNTMDNKISKERSTWDRKDDSSSRVKSLSCKRRPVATSSQFEKVDSSFAVQGGVRSDANNGKGMGLNAHSMNQSSIKTEVRRKGEGIYASNSMDAEIVSFMFSSPVCNSTGSVSSRESPEKTRTQGELMYSTSHQKKVIQGAKFGDPSYQRGTEPRGDMLSALLKQKLKELTCADGDDLEAGNALTGKCTASILPELISALITLNPTNQENGDSYAAGNNLSYGSPRRSQSNPMHGQMFNIDRKSQVDPKARLSSRFQLIADCDHPSPTSILDASFSNDSFCSESLDSSSGHKLNIQLQEQSHENTQSSYHDADLSDSATSSLAGIVKGVMNSVPVDNISLRNSVSGGEVGSKGSKEEFISNAELFENLNLCGADGMADSVINPIFLEKLEILADSLWRSPVCSLDFNVVKEGYQLRRFLFDCMVECLDSKYSGGCKSGFKSWSKLPLFFDRQRLAREVCEEIRRCSDLSGKILNEIIERDMSHSLGKWTDFEIESFETGTEIEGDILQILVDEAVLDLQF